MLSEENWQEEKRGHRGARMRYLIPKNDWAMTLEECARRLGTSTASVAQSQYVAIRKLRKRNPAVLAIMLELSQEMRRARDRREKVEVKR
jgi:hypothetical protein